MVENIIRQKWRHSGNGSKLLIEKWRREISRNVAISDISEFEILREIQKGLGLR